MTRKRPKPGIRCTVCHLRLEFCLCSEIKKFPSKTRLLLVIHASEMKKPTNTGLLATLCLENSVVFQRGLEGTSSTERQLPYDPLSSFLIYPDLAAPLLTREALRAFRSPPTLIVPDGNWKQASRTLKREKGLKDLPRFRLPDDLGPSRYRLRNETHDGGLATFEAISRAFGILEGLELRAQMEELFEKFVERTLMSRGSLPDPERLTRKSAPTIAE